MFPTRSKKGIAVIGIFYKTLEAAQDAAEKKHRAWRRRTVVVRNEQEGFLLITAAQARHAGLLHKDSWRKRATLEAGPNCNRTAMATEEHEADSRIELVCEFCGKGNLAIPREPAGLGFFCRVCSKFVVAKEATYGERRTPKA